MRRASSRIGGSSNRSPRRRRGRPSSGPSWRNDPWCRGVVLLGLEAPEHELEAAFAACADAPIVKGFAVGRTIFNDAAEKWLAGRIDDMPPRSTTWPPALPPSAAPGSACAGRGRREAWARETRSCHPRASGDPVDIRRFAGARRKRCTRTSRWRLPGPRLRGDDKLECTAMSRLHLRQGQPDHNHRLVHVTPETAGWEYVGFDLYRLPKGEAVERRHRRARALRRLHRRARQGRGRRNRSRRASANAWTRFPASHGRSTCPPARHGGSQPKPISSLPSAPRPASPAAASRASSVPTATASSFRGKGNNIRYVTDIIRESDPPTACSSSR